MEGGDEAFGFEREIYWLNEQAEMWLDRIGRTITQPVHVDRVTRYMALSRYRNDDGSGIGVRNFKRPRRPRTTQLSGRSRGVLYGTRCRS